MIDWLQDNNDNAVIHTALLSSADTADVADIVAAICDTDQARADKSFVKQPGHLRYTT